jgi:hypothetical protein
MRWKKWKKGFNRSRTLSGKSALRGILFIVPEHKKGGAARWVIYIFLGSKDQTCGKF